MRTQWSPTLRQQRLLFITIAGLLTSLFLTSKLWTASDRTYPLAPIIDQFTLAPLLTNALFGILIVSLGLSLIWKKRRAPLLFIGLGSLTLLVLADNTRLQPWVFHYGAILFLFAYSLMRKISTSTLLDAARVLVAGIYIWSGIQKINLAFMAEVFPWFTEPLWSPFGAAGLQLAVGFGVFVPFLEAAFGVGFLFKKTRQISLVAAAGMLVVVLASIGPFGHNWNSSVWPWNIAIFLSAFVLFYRCDFSASTLFNRSKQSALVWIAFLLFWIMPAGNLVGVTDHYLSWSLYSGTVPTAILLGDQEALLTLSPAANGGVLQFVEWAHDDVNVVPYPEKRVFFDIYSSVCTSYPQKSFEMVIVEYQFDNRTFDCSDV